MPRIKKVIQLDDDVKVVKKRKTIKANKTKQTITKEMIAEAAYYKSMQRGFIPGFEEDDWIKAESELSSV